MLDYCYYCNDFLEYSITAPHTVGCARPPCTRHSRRFRRRGPRSYDALSRRRHRREFVVSPVLPQGGGPCQSGLIPPLIHDDVTIFHCNIRGFITNSPELEARLLIMGDKRPCIICLTETWLNNSVGSPTLNGYIVISRRDRDDGRIGGGVILFAMSYLDNAISTVLISDVSERILVYIALFVWTLLTMWLVSPWTPW